MSVQMSRLCLFPPTAAVNEKGHLTIGGCDTVALAAEFGTPVYVYDESALRGKCAEFKAEFGRRYPNTTVVYACKAFINRPLARLFKEEGLGLDVVSGGEIGIARSVDFPMEKVYFHGNNKSPEELANALDSGVGRIVVDNFHELVLLNTIAGEKRHTATVLLRITPGVDPHTHQYTSTGNVDSKFGFPLVKAEEAVVAAMSAPNLKLTGLHCHIGSSIYEVGPYQQAIDYMLGFAADMKQKHGFELKELDIGGGFAIQYTVDLPAPPIATFAGALTSSIASGCEKRGMPLPALTIEPGRSIVARAGVALYTVGVVKEIPDVRCYVSVDGGMADNIRPALYGSKLEGVLANRMKDRETGKFTISGKFCESGDILIRDLELPLPAEGDIMAVAGCGAYSLPQACNYNASFKVPVVLVRDGKARLIRRRETLEDLTRCDID